MAITSPFANTSYIKVDKILLDSIEKAESFIVDFAKKHLEKEAFLSTRNASAVIMLKKTSITKKGHALKVIYQNIILPFFEDELKKEAFQEIEQKWNNAGKPTHRERWIDKGRAKVKEEMPEFEKEVGALWKKKKKKLAMNIKLE